MIDPERTSANHDRIPLSEDLTLDELLVALTKAGIPIDEYGTREAKTVLHLLSEINEGEALMSIDAQHNLYRELNVLWLDVVCELPDGTVYLLKEDRQEFKDGRVKRRELDSSIGEKLKPSEDPIEAASRALNEELGVTSYENLYHSGYTERTFMPSSFPGIESTYKMHQYFTVIPVCEFNADGYIEYQADKTNYYTWRLIHTPSA